MTYGRARLWLGISAVGTLVLTASMVYATNLPQQVFSESLEPTLTAPIYIGGVCLAVAILLAPFDLMGGFVLPNRFAKTNQSFANWSRRYFRAVGTQIACFTFFGSALLWTSQVFGTLVGWLVIPVFMFAALKIQNHYHESRSKRVGGRIKNLYRATRITERWQIKLPEIVVVEHEDPGFTGGIVGFGHQIKMIIPEAWLRFSEEHLALVLSRRAIAVQNRSYQRGLLLGFLWNTSGMIFCSLLPNASLTSLSGITTVFCGFTLWSFLGLLVLPTLSRSASLIIDQQLLERQVPKELILETASSMDALQDDEPVRPGFIETIFHPIPSVRSRDDSHRRVRWPAWNAARSTLFLSWPCLGFLSRAVHCNLGRPELWTMLPID